MALANNPLLTALATAKAQKSASTPAAKAPDPVKDKASSFSSVFAKQATPKSPATDDAPTKVASAKSSTADKKADASQSSAADDKKVADNGNGLPARQVNGKADKSDNSTDKDDSDDDTDDSTDSADASSDSSQVDTLVTDTQSAPQDPTVDPTLVATTPTPEPAPTVVEQQVAVDPATLLSAQQSVVPLPVVQAPTDATEAVDDSFDPHADPLDGLTAVQFALENKAQQTAKNTATTTDASKTTGKQDADADPAQMLAGNLAALGDQPVDKSTTEGGGDKAFGGLIADGLKDVKGATSDTRVDNFAERLAALSQAAQAKPASTPATPLLNQPLAMNQNGWTEGVVNRVMYLSSQNLKQADIQLQPAELGRLDIRVNMAADQQTQVTFMSAHVGVRDALESQMARLRDAFVQQGMGQVDVNVSDQSRGWQQQAQQQSGGDGQRGNGSGSANGVGGSDLIADGAPVDAATAAASAPLTVVGSSAVDYYA
ncbi:flagellar hook-length control protein FliK [Pseudomonas sp. NPDC090202]|uniref:flagellar hook-length control protein FliK n=1 Tax=unclassified Pseudomonas TaxID=196821 RepID=UPI0038145827